ncbi:MAG: hypothetical protein IPJ30_04235 [Acidobacteria bacterium]|nr:hypothetical protein [Acidobacteriota bacterium]
MDAGIERNPQFPALLGGFFERNPSTTLVNYMQMVELRRRSAKELHLLAGVAGENMISAEMTKHVAGMIRLFINKAKEKLER